MNYLISLLVILCIPSCTFFGFDCGAMYSYGMLNYVATVCYELIFLQILLIGIDSSLKIKTVVYKTGHYSYYNYSVAMQLMS